LQFVENTKPFTPVYSVYNHEYLGTIIGAYVVEVNNKGNLTLTYQRLLPDNREEFDHGLDDTDRRLIDLLHEITPQAIIKRNSRGEMIKAPDFFRNKFKNVFREKIIEGIQKRMNEALRILRDHNKNLYIQGHNGNPANQKIEIHKDKASVLFHFYRNENDINYYPTLKFKGKKLDFPPSHSGNHSKDKDPVLLCMEPAWMLMDKDVFTLEGNIEGKKLEPFLTRKFMSIPLSIEHEFHKKFVEPLLRQSYSVAANGFEIEIVRSQPKYVLSISEESNKIFTLKPEVRYGPYTYPLSIKDYPYHVHREKLPDGEIRYFRILRDINSEINLKKFFDKLEGMDMFQSAFSFTREKAYEWLFDHAELILGQGIEIQQDESGEFLHFQRPELVMETEPLGDWFDIKAIVKIGKFQIPFLKFRRNILQNIREFKLPDGTQVLLPSEWFTDFRHLMEVAEKDDEHLRIRKYHAGLLDQLPGNAKEVLHKLSDFEKIDTVEKPAGLVAELRPYQQSGLDWLNFLNEYSYGGILADDMGLGKTLQTLSFIQLLKERGILYPVLIIMPTSLLYNWHQEAGKFTPDMKILVYRGLQREKEIENFEKYDLVITSYGVARNDESYLRNCPFSYMILDESQVIKNHNSKTAQALRTYSVRKRLTLTGTPIENSTMDLWSQINFLNPGLLGGETFFRNYYATPIDKEQNAERAEKLRGLIKPFILRRTKEQVATELPPKIEQVHYCEMTEEQASCYEEEKSRYRNAYLTDLKEIGEAKSKFNLLAGLQKLRQIALHPGITGFPDVPSGKFEELLRMISEIVEKGSKVLIFSQFVKMLDLLKKEIETQGMPYAYIDGSVKDRMQEVEKFQETSECQIFLISLKAGGTGLNLTAAEYVFILDPWWNPAAERQASDRAHRIGQQKTVFIYKFISRGTIEEKILKLQEKKSKIASDLIQIEEEFYKSLTEDDIKLLLT